MRKIRGDTKEIMLYWGEKQFCLRDKSLFFGIYNYFQALKIYNQGLKIYNQAMKINFQSLKIVLSAVLKTFISGIRMFCP